MYSLSGAFWTRREHYQLWRAGLARALLRVSRVYIESMAMSVCPPIYYQTFFFTVAWSVSNHFQKEFFTRFVYEYSSVFSWLSTEQEYNFYIIARGTQVL